MFSVVVSLIPNPSMRSRFSSVSFDLTKWKELRGRILSKCIKFDCQISIANQWENNPQISFALCPRSAFIN